MLANIKGNFEKLISLYESERERADALQAQVIAGKTEILALRKQIADLERKVDNLGLSGAFAASADNAQAKARIDGLIREIDRCISLLEK